MAEIVSSCYVSWLYIFLQQNFSEFPVFISLSVNYVQSGVLKLVLE